MTAGPIIRPSADNESLLFANPLRGTHADEFRQSREPLRFHERLPGYELTRLLSLDDLAAEMKLEHLWLKDESFRFGVPSFKVLGVSWATYRALTERLRLPHDEWANLSDLRELVAQLGPLTLLTATGGNHGRAVARVARWFGCSARIFTPRATPAGRIAALRSEGAEVVIVDGSYEDAVEAAAVEPAPDSLLIQDTASDEAETIPAWIVAGYSTIFWEIDRQLQALDQPLPDMVIIQIGVGSLAGAAAAHFGARGGTGRPALVGVEPLSAACLLESAHAGGIRTAGPGSSIMDCINAGRPSAVTLDSLLAQFDAFTAVDDERVPAFMRALARRGVVSGTTGVAGLVGLAAIRGCFAQARSALVINTEGAADLEGYARTLLT